MVFTGLEIVGEAPVNPRPVRKLLAALIGGSWTGLKA